MLESIYRWFIPLYGSDLGKHLSGWDVTTGAFTKTDIFVISGIVMLASTLLTGATYYLLYDHPRMNRWWSWLLAWLIPVSLLNLVVGFAITITDLKAENISTDLTIYWYNCLGFGIANFIVSVMMFILFSLIFRFFSRNNRYSPL